VSTCPIEFQLLECWLGVDEGVVGIQFACVQWSGGVIETENGVRYTWDTGVGSDETHAEGMEHPECTHHSKSTCRLIFNNEN
jgi:hypothetical protein